MCGVYDPETLLLRTSTVVYRYIFPLESKLPGAFSRGGGWRRVGGRDLLSRYLGCGTRNIYTLAVRRRLTLFLYSNWWGFEPLLTTNDIDYLESVIPNFKRAYTLLQ